jgi:predicted nicotinamide N-methyase
VSSGLMRILPRASVERGDAVRLTPPFLISPVNMATIPSDSLLAQFAPPSPVDGSHGIIVHQTPDVFALWHAWEEECGARQDTPFWAVVWPGAVVLAGYLGAHPELVRGRTVLELGCGGGVAAIAAARSGAARVTANDVDPVALHVTQLNAALNRVAVEVSNADLTEHDWPHGVDVILLADFFYERGAAEQMLSRLRERVKDGATVLIADGGRPFAPHDGVEVVAESDVRVNEDLEGVCERHVRLLRLQAPPAACHRPV